MLISEAIKELQSMLDKRGDLELVLCDLDTEWSLSIEKHNITYYKGVCEIYFKDKCGAFDKQGYQYDN